MQAHLLAIGAELISGATVNTNVAYLSRTLAELGIACRRHVAVGDDPPDIIAAITDALSHAQLVVITGGLGPTFDDTTMESLAQATGRSLVFHRAVAARIRQFYTRRRRRLQQAALRQAWLPRGGVALTNPIGTAPGLWLRHQGRVIVALPGVPAEMRAITEHELVRRLRRVGAPRAIETLTLRTIGVVELSIESMLRRVRVPRDVQVGLYPNLRAVDIRLTVATHSPRAASRRLHRVAASLRRALGVAVYGTNTDTLEGVVGQGLVTHGLTLALAESCTGGLLADRVTDVPGSSRYFVGGLVAYADTVKTQTLHVSAELLRRVGAVSAPVARAMAQGVRRMTGADIGLAITGIAGPTGATLTKPVGLVYLGLAGPTGSSTRRFQFLGDRAAIKFQATQAALDWLRRTLQPHAQRASRSGR